MATKTSGAGDGWQEQDRLGNSSAQSVEAGAQGDWGEGWGGGVIGVGPWGLRLPERDQVPVSFLPASNAKSL